MFHLLDTQLSAVLVIMFIFLLCLLHLVRPHTSVQLFSWWVDIPSAVVEMWTFKKSFLVLIKDTKRKNPIALNFILAAKKVRERKWEWASMPYMDRCCIMLIDIILLPSSTQVLTVVKCEIWPSTIIIKEGKPYLLLAYLYH